MRKVWSFTIWVFGIFVLAAGCASPSGGTTIKVGGIGELTGDIPAVGASFKNAAEMAVQEINAVGGLEMGGRKYQVELFLEDNAGQAEQSATAVQKLIQQQNVVAIVGPNASRYAIPAAEMAERSQVALITPWSTNPKTTLDVKTNLPKKYVFRACFTDSFQGRVVARFALENLKAKSAAVLYDVASDANKGQAELFKQTFEANGGQVVSFETYTTGEKDFTVPLTQIKNAKPDVVFLPNYYNEVPLQIQQAKRLGITAPFLGSDAWGSAELVKLCGRDCEGYYFSTHYAADNASPLAQKFIEGYRAKYNSTPDDVAALTYDSFGLLWTALKNAGQRERQAVRDALAKISQYEGVTGQMQFLEGSGDPVKSAVIQQIKDGKFIFFANVNP